MRTIYCYHFESVNQNRVSMGQKPIFKIGDTTIIADSSEEAAEKRVAQQDSTSCFENLTLDFAQEIPNTFLPKIDHVDKEFHKWLQKNKGIYKFRKDADREWFAFNSVDEIKEYLNEFLFGAHAKNNFQMHPAQQQGHDKIVKYFSNNGSEFLLAAKMRFGKNFTFLNVIKTLGYKNILVLTYKPSVFDSLSDDIINHINFVNDFVYISYKENKQKLKLTNKVNIVSCSAQMAGYIYKDEEDSFEEKKVNLRKNLSELSKHNWDLIVTDECHYGATTENFKNICSILNCNRILYISGTPFKTIGNFEDDALFMYTYLDEQNDPNNTMPKLYQYGIKMDTKLIAAYKKLAEIVEYPTMCKVFQCNKNNEFIYPEIAKGTIDNILNSGIRQKGMKNIKHMFILFDHVDACIAATNYINEQYGKSYIGINCAGKTGLNDVQDLKEIIAEAIEKDKGTITCSCGRFIEGVSIKEWNAVIFCNDISSPERYFQAMFRGQTPADWKTEFYVIDYNPERMLSLNFQLISELPTGNKSKTRNNREDNIKEWLQATKIVVIDNDTDQTIKEVNYIDIEKTYFNSGSANNKFSDRYVVNRIHNITLTQDDCKNILNNIERVNNGLIKDHIVNTNGLEGGKNKVSTFNNDEQNNSKQIEKKKIKKDKDITISEVVESIKNVLKFIPKFLIVYNCHTLEEIINKLISNKNDEIDYFENMINVNARLFISIATVYNIINSDGFKYACDLFWEQYNQFGNEFANAKDKHNFYLTWNIFK